MDVESRFWVRVLIANDIRECIITSPSGIRINEAGPFPRVQPAEALMTARSPARVSVAAARLSFSGIAAPGSDIVISAEGDRVIGLNDQRYRGRLRLTVNPDGRTFTIINFVPLEPYLAGVVGAEMPDYWEPEALKAQAIAARTYCLYAKNRAGRSRDWDVASTQSSQVYRGVNAESAMVWDAVNSTYGKVMMTRSGRSSSDGLFPAYFSSVCGGHTEDGDHVFPDSADPLKGVPCPYCRDTARMTLFYWPTAQFDRDTISKRLFEKYPKLEPLGSIKGIEVAEKSTYDQFSRITRVRLVGENGKSDTIRGEDLRLTIDPTGKKMQSAACTIVPTATGWNFYGGRGWGHGVGMCQYGAEGMARQGKKYQDILHYYYSNCEIVNLY
jgi:stage II sporulation protein D